MNGDIESLGQKEQLKKIESEFEILLNSSVVTSLSTKKIRQVRCRIVQIV